MGLLKARVAAVPAAIANPGESHDLATLLDRLAAPDASVRRGAARALRRHEAAVPELAAALSHEPERPVQQAVIGALIEIATLPAIDALVELLPSEDAWLRNAALEALQAIGPAALASVHARLTDPDPRTRISVVVTLSGLPSDEVEALLVDMIEHETDVNVLAAIIEALDLVGGPAALPALGHFMDSTDSDPFLVFAAGSVHARLVKGAG
ncbi:HEAT repeat domain-containing protein [Acidisoma sp.]|uniref:HEAT repeat domain-containing protein n=1 Tax=Acidisoma sp. TaxID=1872115 RepID=UPI003B008A22